MKYTVNELIAMFLTVAGVVMIYIAIFTPPIGIISESVLWALGQLLTTIAALLGVTQYCNSRIKNIEKKISKHEDKL